MGNGSFIHARWVLSGRMLVCQRTCIPVGILTGGRWWSMASFPNDPEESVNKLFNKIVSERYQDILQLQHSSLRLIIAGYEGANFCTKLCQRFLNPLQSII